MAFANLLGRMTYPYPLHAITTSVSQALDSATDRIGFIVQAPKSGNIVKVHYYVPTFTSNSTIDVRLETVSSANGHPTGTLLATNTNGSDSVTTSGWRTVTLTAQAVVTAGDIFAIVLSQGTPGVITAGYYSGMIGGFAYVSTNAGAGYTKSQAWAAWGALEYDDGIFKETNGLLPFKGVTTTAFTSASSPATRALRFSLPFPTRLRGFWVTGSVTASATVTFRLYDSDGTTVLRTITYDTDNNALAALGCRQFDFTSDVNLLKNTYYRISISPDTNSYSQYEFQANTAALMDAYGIGQTGHLSTVSGTPSAEGDWTQTLTTVPIMGLVLSGADDGVSAGGMIVHPGMSGGMRG